MATTPNPERENVERFVVAFLSGDTAPDANDPYYVQETVTIMSTLSEASAWARRVVEEECYCGAEIRGIRDGKWVKLQSFLGF